MSNIKEINGKPRVYASANLLLGVWPPPCVVYETEISVVIVVVVVVVRTRPRTIPLAMITMSKFIDEFP